MSWELEQILKKIRGEFVCSLSGKSQVFASVEAFEQSSFGKKLRDNSNQRAGRTCGSGTGTLETADRRYRQRVGVRTGAELRHRPELFLKDGCIIDLSEKKDRKI